MLTSRVIKKLGSLNDLLYFQVFGGYKAAKRAGVRVSGVGRFYSKFWGSEPFLISIGNNVTITKGTQILTHDGATSLVKNQKGERYQKFGPVSIGDDVFIGINSIILPGVTIGNQCVIAAGSVVTKDIPERSVVAGNPARPISDYETYCSKISNTCASNGDLIDYRDYSEKVNIALKIQGSK